MNDYSKSIERHYRKHHLEKPGKKVKKTMGLLEILIAILIIAWLCGFVLNVGGWINSFNFIPCSHFISI